MSAFKKLLRKNITKVGEDGFNESWIPKNELLKHLESSIEEQDALSEKLARKLLAVNFKKAQYRTMLFQVVRGDVPQKEKKRQLEQEDDQQEEERPFAVNDAKADSMVKKQKSEKKI